MPRAVFCGSSQGGTGIPFDSAGTPIPFARAPSSWPDLLPGALPPIPSHWALGFDIWILGWGADIQWK